jgi:hypothetical protein
MQKQHSLAFIIAFSSQLAFAANTKDLSPINYSTQQGLSGTEAVTVLNVQNETGTAETANSHITLSTPNTTNYIGYRLYQLPATLLPTWINKLQLRANYKGDTINLQTWTWFAYDWLGAKWVKLGDNTQAGNNTWTLLSFAPAANPQRFVNDTGKIKIKFISNNASDDAKLDYEAIRLTYTINSPVLGGCPMFPANNIWNTPIDTLPVHLYSNNYITTIGATRGFHMDFGSGKWNGYAIGIPYNLVAGTQPKVAIKFDYAGESNPGPYPIPTAPKIEGGSDHHVLIVDKDNCFLYETWDTSKNPDGSWRAGSGAIFKLNSNTLRKDTFTSADAAGLPILPGLVRYDEILAGAIKHAIRFTASRTNGSYVWPARHKASSNHDATIYPPMGMRFRLKNDFNILTAMKKYGIILADNGSDWFISGVPDSRWNNDELHKLDVLHGNSFEAVDASGLMVSPDSGAVKP